MDDCQIAPTVAVMILILTFNFQFSIFNFSCAAYRFIFSTAWKNASTLAICFGI